jgi:hypothetical protein
MSTSRDVGGGMSPRIGSLKIPRSQLWLHSWIHLSHRLEAVSDRSRGSHRLGVAEVTLQSTALADAVAAFPMHHIRKRAPTSARRRPIRIASGAITLLTDGYPTGLPF